MAFLLAFPADNLVVVVGSGRTHSRLTRPWLIVRSVSSRVDGVDGVDVSVAAVCRNFFSVFGVAVAIGAFINFLSVDHIDPFFIHIFAGFSLNLDFDRDGCLVAFTAHPSLLLVVEKLLDHKYTVHHVMDFVPADFFA